MKSTNPFAVHFIARPLKAAPGDALLYVRISIARKRLEISLKKKVPVEYWDSKGVCLKGNKKRMQERNLYLYPAATKRGEA